MQATNAPLEFFPGTSPSQWHNTIYKNRIFGPQDHAHLEVLCRAALPRLRLQALNANVVFQQTHKQALAIYDVWVADYKAKPWWKQMLSEVPGHPPRRRYASFDAWSDGRELQLELERTAATPELFYFEDTFDIVETMLNTR
jgi:hypothetical protein